jgi:hypothetical protein
MGVIYKYKKTNHMRRRVIERLPPLWDLCGLNKLMTNRLLLNTIQTKQNRLIRCLVRSMINENEYNAMKQVNP